MPDPRVGGVDHRVPNYDIFGHQHNRHPFKDKAHLLTKDIQHHKWLQPPPAVKTRAELQQARKRGRHPDSSYDFDGDGVVGSLDYFIGRSFDKDNDGRLTDTERSQARRALENGFLDKYMRGLEATGQAHRGSAVQQKRGVILMSDNAADVSTLTYPLHHNAHVQPPNATKTELHMSRLREAKAAGNAFGERYAAACAPVLVPEPPTHVTEPRTCPVSHIRERAEADHQASRVRGGLMPMNTAVNPERELKTVGLEHVGEPVFQTRSQLLDTRKEAMNRDCEDLRNKGEELCVPNSVRRAEKEAKEFEFRRPDHEPMTLTRLKDGRKRGRMEYDMANFVFPCVAPREYPRFSDYPELPFWLAGEPSGASAPATAPAISRTVSEPALKVTDIPFGHPAERESAATLPAAAHEAAAAGKAAGSPNARIGANTVKRWTADMIDRGQGRNKPRLFDTIQPVRIGPKDLEPLDVHSSLAPVREAALKRSAEERKNHAELPRRSKLWTDPTLVAVGAIGDTMGDGAGATNAPSMQRSLPTGGTNATRSRPHAQSEANLRNLTTMDSTKPRDPKFFGSAEHIQKPSSQSAVRCGGFQRMEWPKPTRPPKGHKVKTDRDHSTSKDQSSTQTAVPAAQ